MFILNFSGSLTEVPCPRLQVRDGYPFPWVGGGGEWKGILSIVAALSKYRFQEPKKEDYEQEESLGKSWTRT